MNEHMVDRIYLIGFMGAGKSTIGKKLARELGYQFIDLDDFFEERFKLSIPAFFNKYGETLFRKLEHERLLKTFDMKGVVIATGGGAPCHLGGIEEINKNGFSIYLDMPPKAIAQRLLSASRKRPLIDGKAGDELTRFIEKKLMERLTYYQQAHIIMDGLHVDVKELGARLRSV